METSEAATRRKNSQENTCGRVSFLIKLQALLEKRLWPWYLEGSISPHKKRFPTLWLRSHDFETSPHLFAPPGPIIMTTMTRHRTKFPPNPSPPSQTSSTNSPPLPRHTNKNFFKCILSKSLTHN